MRSLAYVQSARLALHMADGEQRERQPNRAMRRRPMATYVLPWLAVCLRLQLAKVYLALAEPTTVRHLLREIDDILVLRQALGVLVDQVEEFRRAVSADLTGPTGATPLTPAAAATLPAGAPDSQCDRRAPVRLSLHRQVPGRFHTQEAGCLVASTSSGEATTPLCSGG